MKGKKSVLLSIIPFNEELYIQGSSQSKHYRISLLFFILSFTYNEEH